MSKKNMALCQTDFLKKQALRMMTQRSILFISKGETAASTRYRGLNYFPYLKNAGWHCEHMGIEKATSIATKLLLLRKAKKADVVVVLRKTFTALFIFLLKLFSKRMVLTLTMLY